MEAIIAVVVVVAVFGCLPMAVRRMRHWLRHSRSGGFVGSLGAGIATQLDPAQTMLAAEMEHEEERKGQKLDDGD